MRGEAWSGDAGLVGTRFAGKVRRFASIDSTNAALLEAASGCAAEGTVYMADEQTAGRGRGGHAWHSAAGEGLYLSALVHLPLRLDRVLWISLATGLAVRAAIAATAGIKVDIRWPNDLLYGAKKVGGILVETVLEGAALRYAVIGVGVNLNHTEFPAELAAMATSLRAIGGSAVDRDALVVALLRALDLELARLEAGDDGVLERFAQASTWVAGKAVHVGEAGGYTGLTAGLNAAGFLQVRTADGSLRTVLSGGVRSLATPTI